MFPLETSESYPRSPGPAYQAYWRSDALAQLAQTLCMTHNDVLQ